MDRKFGVEIELIANITPDRIRWAVNKAGEPLSTQRLGFWRSVNNESWELKTDSSVRRGRHGKGLELVTPVLCGEDGIHRMCSVLSVLDGYVREKGIQVFDPSTGLHVHIGCRSTRDVEIARLVWLWGMFQDLMYSVVHPSRANSFHCGKIGLWEKAEVEKLKHYVGLNLVNDPRESAAMGRRMVCRGYNPFADRRSGLNITSMVSKRTVEFRIHHSTVDPQAVSHWVRLCAAFVDRCGRPLNISDKSRVWGMPRLMRVLGWGVKDTSPETMAARDFWLRKAGEEFTVTDAGWVEPVVRSTPRRTVVESIGGPPPELVVRNITHDNPLGLDPAVFLDRYAQARRGDVLGSVNPSGEASLPVMYPPATVVDVPPSLFGGTNSDLVWTTASSR